DGPDAPPAGGGVAPSQRPRRAVRQPCLPTSAARAWDRAEHESQGKLLRQRGDRELLQHAEAGVGLPRGVRGPRGGERVTVRVHRGVLQSPASALDAGLSQSHPVRATIRLVNPSERPRLVGKVIPSKPELTPGFPPGFPFPSKPELTPGFPSGFPLVEY